jgi:predicted lipid carrier protein YhbT
MSRKGGQKAFKNKEFDPELSHVHQRWVFTANFVTDLALSWSSIT